MRKVDSAGAILLHKRTSLPLLTVVFQIGTILTVTDLQSGGLSLLDWDIVVMATVYGVLSDYRFTSQMGGGIYKSQI